MLFFVLVSTLFFAEKLGKIKIVQKFKTILLEEMFYCCLQPHATDFNKDDILYFALWGYFPFIEILSTETNSKLISIQLIALMKDMHKF